MGVNTAGQNEQPSGIVALSILYRELATDRLNAAILNENVTLVVVYGGDNATTLNENRSHSKPLEAKRLGGLS
jgi:hypothetical protein